MCLYVNQAVHVNLITKENDDNDEHETGSNSMQFSAILRRQAFGQQ